VLADIGATLVAISHQMDGLADFQAKYFSGPVFLDEAKTFYKALGNRMAAAADLKLPEVKAAGKAAYKALKGADPTYELSSEGQGALLGGSLVLARHSGDAIFVHREKHFGDVADPKVLLEACRKARL